ncbi:GNAT family N-acetyltransferase [Lacticaseibacillus yichunensis]|uniref:GNAT family N-acetyltransferase n=1 Tax=Lacticaseibacillus yichunensis TaxID=2486015 RepID=A0ABW4CPA3_9LACO|nr:GNAT family N-acetyltransferase [Lacticaseibacillus yichunensis]
MRLTYAPVIRQMKDYPLIKRLYFSAFPAAERAPLRSLLRAAQRPGKEFFAYYHDHQFVGFSYLVTSGDLAYLMFLAVDDKLRGKGYGSQILEAVAAGRPTARLLLNTEVLDADAPNALTRQRRREFYENNGFVSSGWQVTEFGVDYELMCRPGRVSPDEYRDLTKKYAGWKYFLFHQQFARLGK